MYVSRDINFLKKNDRLRKLLLAFFDSYRPPAVELINIQFIQPRTAAGPPFQIVTFMKTLMRYPAVCFCED